jgi:two-component system chemotaxis family response regulator WspR
MSSVPHQPRVLIVDDNPHRQASLRQTVRDHYHGTGDDLVSAVASARDALSLDLSRFDLIVQRAHRPDVASLELLKQLVAVDLPVVIVSDENDPRVAEEALRLGAQDYVVDTGGPANWPLLIEKNLRQYEVRRENQRLQEQLAAMQEELQDKTAQLLSMAHTDSLTNLANRRRFNELLERSFNEATRYGFDLTCCMCDLDDFKRFNDALGHPRGDELLQMTSDLIASGLRSTDVAARYGGDEFVLLLPHTSVDRAVAVCQRIRGRLARAGRKYALSPQGLHIHQRVTISIGIASIQSDNPKTPDDLVVLADRALYAAKGNGKNRIVTLTPLGDQQSA